MVISSDIVCLEPVFRSYDQHGVAVDSYQPFSASAGTGLNPWDRHFRPLEASGVVSAMQFKAGLRIKDILDDVFPHK